MSDAAELLYRRASELADVERDLLHAIGTTSEPLVRAMRDGRRVLLEAAALHFASVSTSLTATTNPGDQDMATKKTEKKIVVVRTYSAGVHVGELVRQEGSVVELANARRVWRWRGANTLHELSQKGADTSYSRISEPVPTITLTGAIEVITCGAVAADNLQTSRWPA